MKTRVCRLYGKGDLRIEEAEVSSPSDGQVLIAIGAGGICGSDLHYYQDGGFGPVQVREPIILGHEIAGTVIEVGANVDNFQAGDHVGIDPSHACQQCKFCRAGMPRHCLNMEFMGSAMRMPHVQGGFRDFVVVNAAQCWRVSPSTSLGEVACAEPLAVCLHAAKRAGPLADKRVLVTGAGPIGALCVAVAKYHQASEIVVSDIMDTKLGIAKEMGASRTINAQDGKTEFGPYMDDKGYFDVAFECSAAKSAISNAFNSVSAGGTIVQVGVTADMQIPLNVLVGKEVNFLGSFRFDREYEEAISLIDNQQIDVKPIITNCFPIESAVLAFDSAGHDPRSNKVQLSFANLG